MRDSTCHVCTELRREYIQIADRLIAHTNLLRVALVGNDNSVAIQVLETLNTARLAMLDCKRRIEEHRKDSHRG